MPRVDAKLFEIQNAGAEIRLAYGHCGAACESFSAPRGALVFGVWFLSSAFQVESADESLNAGREGAGMGFVWLAWGLNGM
jgi:hypothetical protein